MSLPSCVLVGVPRAGTTSLYFWLKQHPQIAVSPVKEINFLSYPGEEGAKDRPWLVYRAKTLEEYRALFDGSGNRTAVDFSASCFYSPVSIARIQTYLPEARLMVVLRDPVRRAYSAYLNRVSKGRESRPPEEALRLGERAVDNGFYADRLEEFFGAFGRDRVRVWLFDDLISAPEVTVPEVLDYIGVDAGAQLNWKTAYNKGKGSRSDLARRLTDGDSRLKKVYSKLPPRVQELSSRVQYNRPRAIPEMSHELKAELASLYAEDISKLERMLGRDLSHWQPGRTPTEADLSTPPGPPEEPPSQMAP